MNLLDRVNPSWMALSLRVVVALILMSHGAGRVYYRAVDEFGTFLGSQGFPLGFFLAWGVTIFEILGGGALLLGFYRKTLALGFSLEMLLGIILVQWKDGWFVIGFGRNGIEYPLLLIASLLMVAFWRTK